MAKSMEKLLPQSIEAEQAVLGTILSYGKRALVQVADILAPDDFYRDAHRIIYEAILELDRTHHPVDVLTVTDALREKDRLDDVGGGYYITGLIADQFELHLSHPREYAQRVNNAAQRRRLIFAAGQIAALAYEQEQSDIALAQAEQLLRALALGKKTGQAEDMAAIGAEYINRLDALQQQCRAGTITGVPTGFTDLDRMTGGLQKADLIVLAARPGKGKTGLALSLARYVMHFSGGHGFKTLMFSLEMSKWQLAQRYFAMDSGVDQSRLRTAFLDQKDWDAVVEAQDRIPAGRFWIDDEAGLSVQEVRSRARRHQSEHGLDLVIVDYMQLMTAMKDDGSDYDNRVEEVDKISRELKNLARELNIPVLALAQLSRKVEERAEKVPQLSDLRESGGIEQNSDIVMFLYEDPKNTPTEQGRFINLIVAKHRQGEVGSVSLFFRPSLTRFDDIDVTVVESAPVATAVTAAPAQKQIATKKQASSRRAWNDPVEED